MAMQVLERQNVYDPDLLVYRTALGMVRNASLNCYIFDVRLPCPLMASTDHPRLEEHVLHTELKYRFLVVVASCPALQAEKNDTIETRMSLLQRQLGIGNACTFQLIEKNVTSLLPKSKEQLKEDAKQSLNDLLRYHPYTWTRVTKHLPWDDDQYKGSAASAFCVMQVISEIG